MTACLSGKRQFDSRRDANRILGRIWRMCKPGRRMETRAYWCHMCQHWHLTSKPQSGRNR